MEACAPSPEADRALDVASFTANPFGTDEILALWSKAISAENFAVTSTACVRAFWAQWL